MCLAVPMKISAIDSDSTVGTVAVKGGELEIGLDLVPEAKIGDYVLVHAGMAIERLKDEDAEAMLAAIDEYVHTMDEITPPERADDES